MSSSTDAVHVAPPRRFIGVFFGPMLVALFPDDDSVLGVGAGQLACEFIRTCFRDQGLIELHSMTLSIGTYRDEQIPITKLEAEDVPGPSRRKLP